MKVENMSMIRDGRQKKVPNEIPRDEEYNV